MITADEVKNVFLDEELNGYIKERLYDPWVGTVLEGYRYMDNKQKGGLGELFVEKLMERLGHVVEKPVNTAHDRIINGIKTEIKFSVAHTDHKKKEIKEDCFTLNHVSEEKDWERLVFAGMNPDLTMWCVYFTKEQFKEMLATGEYFSAQQGGKKLDNDDYLIASTKLKKLLNSEYVQDVKGNW
jgi:hypothetical protein